MRKLVYMQGSDKDLEKLLEELEEAWANTELAESRVYHDLEDWAMVRKAAKAGRAEQRRQKREGLDG